jgi:dolichyl-phosphate beta-glucosyltransferase
MKLSIIIPIFNEERKIKQDILAADVFLKENKIDGEVIVVDDGSEDGSVEVVRVLQGKVESPLTLLINSGNIGKGDAVKKGVLASKGEFILYADSGLTIPFNNLFAGLKMIEIGECDIAFGSRKLTQSKILIQKQIDRKITSLLFTLMARVFLNIPNYINDTQCGFKLYRGNLARNLFVKLKTPGFLFELEIINRALKENYIIKEFPVEWRCDRDSRINYSSTPISVLKEAIHLRRLIRKEITN